VVGEADRLHRHFRDQWTAHVTILRQDQIQDVAADMSWNADVLMQVVQVEQVDNVTVELLNVVAWHVEVADYMARYSLFVLKVPLNPNQPTNLLISQVLGSRTFRECCSRTVLQARCCPASSTKALWCMWS